MQTRRATHLGRYEILEELGRGAMGIVYKARDPQIDRFVALKTIALLGPLTEDQQEYLQRFAAEARAAGRLSHPGIVAIFDVGEEAESHNPFIVMEYVAGQSLNDILKKITKLPVELALQIAHELAEALDYAHTRGVVHRDVKPANILITDNWHVKITDFGIAKMNLAQMTVHRYAIGTPAYMSPEQLEGEEVDGRSDIFSLGVILYTTLTGYRPFQGASAATVSFKVANRDPVPVSALDAQIPSEVDYVISRALAKHPAQRYQTGREIALDIHELLRSHLPRSSGEPSIPNPGSALPDSAIKLLEGSSTARTSKTYRSSLFRTPTQLFSWSQLIFLLAAMTLASALSIAAFVGFSRRRAAWTTQASAMPTAPSLTLAQTASFPYANSRGVGSIPAKPSASSILRVRIEHHFVAAKLTVWIDNKLAYSQLLHGENKRRFLLLHGLRGSASAMIGVAPGFHQVKVRVQAEDEPYDQTQTIVKAFPAQQVVNLRIACSKQGPKLFLAAQSDSH